MNAQTVTAAVGRTERAFGALLLDALAGSPVEGGDEWVTLVVAGTDPGPDLTAAVRAVLRSPRTTADAVDSLRRKGVLDGDRLTEHGRATLVRLRAGIAARTAELVDGLDEAEVAAAVRVLDALRDRAVALVERSG